MSTPRDTEPRRGPVSAEEDPRDRLLAGVPVTERRVGAAGLSTAVLEGGDGPPIVLLHGPGESAVNWRWVIPDLVTRHRVIAPDLPAHGDTDAPEASLDLHGVLGWLDGLIDATCTEPPVLIGHVLGGAIGARFAVDHGESLRHLVLVDTLGLARFRPSPKFALTFAGFQARPTERTYTRFMRQCAFDLDALRDDLGERWGPFVSYNLASAQGPKAKAAGRLMRKVGLPRIPQADLERITVPTTLIWGRHDRANRLRIAEDARDRYGWPLHVIEDAADDPPRDRPAAFLEALHGAIDGSRD